MENTGKKEVHYCSFCGKSQNESWKMIASPNAIICDECVDLCVDILEEESSIGTEDEAIDTCTH